MWSPKRQEGPTKIIGPAYTVKYVRNNHGTDPKPQGHYVSQLNLLMIFLWCSIFRYMTEPARRRCLATLLFNLMGKIIQSHPSHTPNANQIDTVPPGSVVFISAPANIVNAVYGGLMSNRAQYSSAVGTIVDGRVRDLQEHRDLKYPVFARDIGTTAPAEVVRVSEVCIFPYSAIS